MKRMASTFLIAATLWFVSFGSGYQVISHLPSQSAPTEIGLGNLMINNLLVLLLTLAGLLTAGLASIVEMIVNGFFVGAMTKMLVLSGLPLAEVFAISWRHALPELAGFWLAAGVGLEGGAIAWSVLLGREYEFPARRVFVGAGLALVLVIAAAAIEVNVSLPRALQQYARAEGREVCEQDKGPESGGDAAAYRPTLDCLSPAEPSLAQ